MIPRVFDLFCGGGGSSFGARQAGAEIAGGLDCDELATRTFAANFTDAKTYHIRAADADLPAIADDVGKVDLLLASPECTSHTNARGNLPKSESSMDTAHEVAHFAKALDPTWIVVENVPGMLRWHGINNFVDGLNGLDYSVYCERLSAGDFGVCSNRDRLFFICAKDANANLFWRLPIVPGKFRRPVIRDILDDDAKWPRTPLYIRGRSPKTLDKVAGGVAALGANATFIIRFYGVPKGDSSRRWLGLDEPLGTVTRSQRFAVSAADEHHGRTLRMLRSDELARAMGIGEGSGFRLPEKEKDRLHIIGNMVCPPVMRAIVEAIMESENGG